MCPGVSRVWQRGIPYGGGGYPLTCLGVSPKRPEGIPPLAEGYPGSGLGVSQVWPGGIPYGGGGYPPGGNTPLPTPYPGAIICYQNNVIYAEVKGSWGVRGDYLQSGSLEIFPCAPESFRDASVYPVRFSHRLNATDHRFAQGA